MAIGDTRPCAGGCGAIVTQPRGPRKLYCDAKCKDRSYDRTRAKTLVPTHCMNCGAALPTRPRGGNPQRYCQGKPSCRRRAQWKRDKIRWKQIEIQVAGYAPDEAAAIAAALAAGKVTRIEKGAWPDTGREELRTWCRPRRRARRRPTARTGAFCSCTRDSSASGAASGAFRRMQSRC